MKYEFDFKMNAETLEDFYKSHSMAGVAGFLWPMLGFAGILLAIISTGAPIYYRGIYAVFGLMFLVYIPWDLKRKAKKQVEKNPYYAAPIHYVIDEDGITTTQGEKEGTVTWDKFSRVKVTKKSVIIYMRNKNACVLSTEVFGKDLDKAYEFIEKKVSHKEEDKDKK